MTGYITRSQFRKLWNHHCAKTFGLSADDLPDILCMDDYWYEEMTKDEATSAFADMEMEMRQEFGCCTHDA